MQIFFYKPKKWKRKNLFFTLISMFVFDIIAIIGAFLSLGFFCYSYKKVTKIEQKRKEKQKFLFPFTK